MGNFWIPQFDSSSSSRSSTSTSSPGNTSNGGTHSGTGSAFSSRLDEVSPNGQILPTPPLRAFTFAELKTATRNFCPDTLLGEGGFGKVFKGWIDFKAGSGMAIAVKKMKPECRQGYAPWLAEVNILWNLSHPNIVSPFGYCSEGAERLLIYEFMPRGSLSNHLFDRGSPLLPWSIRLKIAIGVARGLAFLHCSERRIILCNLTPYNVLIDSNYNAKISDVGLARLGEGPYVSTLVMGTCGYADPEYLATGHKARDPNRPSGQHNLVDWAKPYLSDERKVSQLMDRRLVGQYPSGGAVLAAQLILACLSPYPRNRPSMTKVVEALEEIRAIKHEACAPRTKD